MPFAVTVSAALVRTASAAARSSLSFIAFQGADAWSKTIPNGRAAHGTATAAETIAQNARCFAECMFFSLSPCA